jgi:ABC-type multidrug transport system permease subunit
VLVMLTVASMCLGLLISAAAGSAEQAVGLMSGVLAFMVILSGVVIPIGAPRGGEYVLSWLSYLVPTRWAISGVAAAIDLPGASGSMPDPSLQDGMWAHDWWHCGAALAVLILTSLLTLVAATRFVAVGSGRER